jgi:phage shock protein PspC (stress-responsive transcriptional regulator)
MNQTQGPSTKDEQQSRPADAQGVDRQNLRNYEQLRRSITDRKVAGVAGGLGRHLNIDPNILRVLFVVLCFFGGAGFVAYGAAWLLVPEDGQAEGKVPMSAATRNGLLIATGVLAALLVLGDSWNGIGFPWPLVLVGFGVLLYLAFREKEPRASTPPGPSYGPSYGPAPDPAGTADLQEQPPAPPWAPVTGQGTPAYPPPRPPRGPKLFGFTLALVAVALGALGLYDASGGSVAHSAYPALALAVVGLMLVLGAFVGRAGGLIFLGIVSAAALVGTSVADGVDFGNGERVSVAPSMASNVRTEYSISSGRLRVDLSRVSNPAALDGRTVNITAEAGEIVVILPDGIESDVRAGIDGPGQIDLPDRGSGGISSDLDGVYGTGTGTVTIRTHLSVGHIDVRNPR